MQYTAAVKTSSLEPTAKAIASLGSLVEKDQKLVSILNAPTLSAADKSAIVAELVKTSGVQGETVKNFLSTLAENNRLGLLPGVVSKFAELMSAARGEVEVVVTSAQVRRLIESSGYTDENFLGKDSLTRGNNNSRWITRPSRGLRLPFPSHRTSARARSSRSPTRYAPIQPTPQQRENANTMLPGQSRDHWRAGC